LHMFVNKKRETSTGKEYTKKPSKMSKSASRVWEVFIIREHLNFEFDFIITFLLSWNFDFWRKGKLFFWQYGLWVLMDAKLEKDSIDGVCK
jgi:hypothetical protein